MHRFYIALGLAGGVLVGIIIVLSIFLVAGTAPKVPIIPISGTTQTNPDNLIDVTSLPFCSDATTIYLPQYSALVSTQPIPPQQACAGFGSGPNYEACIALVTPSVPNQIANPVAKMGAMLYYINESNVISC